MTRERLHMAYVASHECGSYMATQKNLVGLACRVGDHTTSTPAVQVQMAGGNSLTVRPSASCTNLPNASSTDPLASF